MRALRAVYMRVLSETETKLKESFLKLKHFAHL